MLPLWISSALAACVPSSVPVHPPDGADVPRDTQAWVSPFECLQPPLTVQVDGGTPFNATPVGNTPVDLGPLGPGEHVITFTDAGGLWRERVTWNVLDQQAPDPTLPQLTTRFALSTKNARNQYSWVVGFALDFDEDADPLSLARATVLLDGRDGQDIGWWTQDQAAEAAAGAPEGGGITFGSGTTAERPLEEVCVRIQAASVDGRTISEEICEPATQEEDVGCGCSTSPPALAWAPLAGLLALIGLRRRS